MFKHLKRKFLTNTSFDKLLIVFALMYWHQVQKNTLQTPVKDTEIISYLPVRSSLHL